MQSVKITGNVPAVENSALVNLTYDQLADKVAERVGRMLGVQKIETTNALEGGNVNPGKWYRIATATRYDVTGVLQLTHMWNSGATSGVVLGFTLEPVNSVVGCTLVQLAGSNHTFVMARIVSQEDQSGYGGIVFHIDVLIAKGKRLTLRSMLAGNIDKIELTKTPEAVSEDDGTVRVLREIQVIGKSSDENSGGG